ncbi:bifunctional ADP-dependent NAD(P)H-hydrate dehydratase/NAD(P)H-hydrate epimerase [candidate division KSB1 bacterium]|nr:MAG: bifunctional ADP-dependent NAD(P)H-hydrate dehydratase/NAD(P)H-hydrate epimerase [candidate division KSB1 bacterium]
MEVVVTADEMRRIDRIMIDEIGIPGIVLMENAGLKTAQAIAQYYAPVSGKAIVILCGKGNNGGDGFVVGRHLAAMGARVQIFLLGDKDAVTGDAKVNLEIAQASGLTIQEILDWTEFSSSLPQADIFVDALLGTGVKGEVKGLYRLAIEWLNSQRVPIVAIDAPSGVNNDDGNLLGVGIRAEMTVTMGNIKTGMLFYPGRAYGGRLLVADLNIPSSVYQKVNSQKFIATTEDVRRMLPQRRPNGYKNTFGKVLLFAGSTGLTGAAALSSMSVLKSGAGMAILALPKSLNAIMEGKITEVMTAPLPETNAGSINVSAIGSIDKLMDWCHVIAIGPGLSTHPETSRFVVQLLKKANKPLVIDADGINNLSGEIELIRQYPADVILTPHVGELARLIQKSNEEILQNRVQIVREWATILGKVLLLKGVPTIIGDPRGNIYFNLTANSGMATAGCGDVLTGIIAGFLAQGMPPLEAAVAGAFVHGLAGDLAKESLGARGMIASDIQNHVPAALQTIERGNVEEDTKRTPFRRLF